MEKIARVLFHVHGYKIAQNISRVKPAIAKIIQKEYLTIDGENASIFLAALNPDKNESRQLLSDAFWYFKVLQKQLPINLAAQRAWELIKY